MRTQILVVLAITILEQSSSSPDAVDDFNRISSSLSQNSRSEMKITEEKQRTRVEIESQGSDQSAFSSQFLHQGHNLFYQPQIIIGPGIKAPFLSRKINDDEERKEQVELHTNETNETSTYEKQTDKLPDIPEAPILPPLVMPNLPTTVIVEEYKERPPVKEIIIERDTVIIPEPPRIPIEVIVSKPLPHIPTCFMSNVKYEISVPCPPTIAVSPAIVGIDKVMVKESLQVPVRSPVLNLRLPRIPLGVVYNKPVKTVVPFLEGFISTTRFLPSVKISKIPLGKYRHQKLLISSRPVLDNIIVEKIRRKNIRLIEEEEGFSSFSAYCAHNIALKRVLPNIIVGK